MIPSWFSSGLVTEHIFLGLFSTEQSVSTGMDDHILTNDPAPPKRIFQQLVEVNGKQQDEDESQNDGPHGNQ